MRSRKYQRGQAVLELALVAPVLILLLLTIFQLTFVFAAQVGVINAARDVARAASGVEVATSANAAAASQTFYNRMTGNGGGGNSLARTISGYQSSAVVTTGSPIDLAVRRTRVCYYGITDVSGAPAVIAYVEVQYRHPLFLPVVSNLIDAFDGSPDGALRLGAIEEIRVGNPTLKPADTDISSLVCNS